LVGSFQAENLAVALGLLVGSGMGWKEIAAAVPQVTSVPGRMEIVKGAQGAPGVVVDYAHKPDALQRALESLRPLVHGKGKLIVVFGCGGNRDATKRPIMGKIAAELADVVFVTDDNPRKEDAGDIRRQVVAGVEAGGKKPRNVGDRRKAIEEAIGNAGPDDVVLVAGKGHEQGQILRDATLPFDDRAVVREVLKTGNRGD
jgi:UDP-N-acetylmuramoyl-L-alanyl-D-glutamate--2,6-diaminopimelate ligase